MYQQSGLNHWRSFVHTQSPVALAISSPTFFGDRPRGPILGARAEEAPTSPPVALKVLQKYKSAQAATKKLGGDSRRYTHFLHLIGIEFWSWSHVCQPAIVYLGVIATYAL